MDITGFEQQIGNPIVNRFAKNIINKPSGFSATALKQVAQNAKAKGLMPTVQKGITAKAFDKIKLNTALLQAKQTGKPVIVKTPSRAIKFAPKTATPFNLVPTASKSLTPALPTSLPVEAVKSEIKQMEQSLQSLPAAKQAQAIFDLPPTPAIVENLSPIQQSFLKTDLPYQVISKNNFGQPRTKFIKNTPLKFNIDIDQIQPPVDSGISNYYGK